MEARSFLMTASGDIDLRFQLTPDLRTYTGQRLRENLSFFLGEWFLDRRQGLPFLQRIIGYKYDQDLIDSIFRRAALATAGVAQVLSLLSKFDRSTRTLSIPRFAVKLRDGSTLTNEDLTAPLIVTYTPAPGEA